MSINTEIYPLIQTLRGNIPLNKLVIGDKVYHYKSGDELEILDIVNKNEKIFKVEFNDERIGFYSYSELEYLRKLTLTQYYINYNKNRIVNPLSPDPYIAGALLIYGDLDDEYVNLPINSENANPLFSEKYHLNYASKLSSNKKAYFTYDGDNPDNMIKWKDFFKNYNILVNKNSYGKPDIIPLEYQRASIIDRYKLIRGIFDIGYDKKTFPQDCGICHNSKEKLMEVQKILWSLGILSDIEYDTSVFYKMIPCEIKIDKNLIHNSENVNVNINFKQPDLYFNKDYRLYVIGKHSIYPGFFYNIESINDMITHHCDMDNYIKFKLQIRSIKLYAIADVPKILLKDPFVPFLTDNFLPKISGRK